MAELTPEERERIYLEEKARLEAQERIQQERVKKNNKGCFIAIAIAVALFLLLAIIAAVNTQNETASPVVQLHAFFFRTSTEIKITNADGFNWTNVELTLNPDVYGNYKCRIGTLKSGESVTINLMSFATKEGARFNPFQRIVKEIHVIAETENGKGATGFRWNN